MVAVRSILPCQISSLVIYRETVQKPEAMSAHHVQQEVVGWMRNRMRNSSQTPPDVTFYIWSESSSRCGDKMDGKGAPDYYLWQRFRLHCQWWNVITARVAKRAKVIFSEASVCLTREGEVGNHGPGHNTSLPPRDQVTTPPSPPGPGHNTSPPETRSQHLPPRTRSQHLPPPLPGPGHNTSLPLSLLSRDQVTTPPSSRDQVTTPPPLGPGHNTSQPPPLLGQGHNTSLPPSQLLPPPVLYAVGRYASYWNAFLLKQECVRKECVPSALVRTTRC